MKKDGPIIRMDPSERMNLILKWKKEIDDPTTSEERWQKLTAELNRHISIAVSAVSPRV